LAQLYDCSICIVDKEDEAAFHTSSRNTGVIHRPFYLNPDKRKIFAASSQKSYYLWASLAKHNGLPWMQAGTLELALRDEDLRTLEQYEKWSMENGMDDDEIAILDPMEAKQLEREIVCLGAIHSKTDTSVDYGKFTRTVLELAMNNGVSFLARHSVTKLRETEEGVTILVRTSDESGASSVSSISCKLLINTAGGASLDFAHSLDLAEEYADLHFRGDYWVVEPSFGARISRNIYTVAKYKEFLFLDPHFIVRSDGSRQIGPNAALVTGPYAYTGMSSSLSEFVHKIFEKPNSPKLRLFSNRKFLSLVWDEWSSSRSKDAMCKRVRAFIPSLDTSFLTMKGTAGVRSSLINRDGFVPEAVLVESANSFHVLNYNSPGATGAPAFSAYLVTKLNENGFLKGMVQRFQNGEKKNRPPLWDFEKASDLTSIGKLGN
jgi:(S)-2-hydroxyglutarate dehydrogenase